MKTRSPKNFNYETTINEIEAIIQQMESGTLPLKDVFQQFAIATEKLKACEQFLNLGQEKMKLLIETFESPEEIEF